MTNTNNPQQGQQKGTNQPAATTPAVISQKELTEGVLGRIRVFQDNNELKLPADYSVENAIKSAYFELQRTVDINKKPVLSVCTRESIANAVLEMAVQGLNIMKKQCYFIAYGDQLTMQRSYQGDIAVARRVSNLEDVNTVIIYEGDVFEYETDLDTGRQRVTKHVPKFENINLEKIKGAFAIVTERTGAKSLEIMTIEQIKKSWAMSKNANNNIFQRNFPDEAAMRTIIRRATKPYINQSDDAYLYENEEREEDQVMSGVKQEIRKNGNGNGTGKTINIEAEDAQVVSENPGREPAPGGDEPAGDAGLFAQDDKNNPSAPY